MAIKGVDPKCYILALFVREDGERFLLGSGRYVFKEKQQHFQANKMANDVVEVQGNDGYLLAGQVRRPGTQDFDGYVGDGTSSKAQVEQWRRDFFKFFRKNYLYKVIYVFSDGSAIQRKRGFLVDAPTVEELYQIYPEYHVALNFEDINYYFYNEDSEGHEIYGKSAIIGLTVGATGGLMWDSLGAISLPYSWLNPVSVSGTEIQINNQLSAEVPITDLQLDGDTSQQTYSGKNLIDISNISGAFNSTYSVNGNSISVTNTKPEISTCYLSLEIPDSDNLLGKKATLKVGKRTSTSSSPNIEVAVYQSKGGASVGSLVAKLAVTPVDGASVTFTFPSTYSPEQVKFVVLLYSGTFDSSSNTTTYANVQLELGSSASDYEPYVGGTASPNPDYPQDINVVTGEQTVTVTGKNILTGNYTAGTDQSVGHTWDNVFVTLSGTAGNSYSTITPATMDIPISPGTYTFSTNKATSQFTKVIRIRYSNSNHDYSIAKNSTSINFTVPDSATDAVIRSMYISGFTSSTVISYTFGVMLEQGSSPTSFEPYQHQEYEVNLGKNLFDKNDAASIIDKMYINANSSTFALVGSSAAAKTIYVPCLPNTTYTVSKNVGTRFIVATSIAVPQNGGQADNIITNNTAANITITTGANAKYLVAWVYNSTDTGTAQDMLDSVQIELGPQATTYAPYFTPIELAKIGTYQDYIYKSGDDWYVHKDIGKYTFTGSENWTSGAYGVNSWIINGKITTTYDTSKIQVISNLFRGVANDDRATSGDNIIFTASNNDVWIRNTSLTTLEQVQSSTAGGYAYFALATPTDTKITDATLIGELDGLEGMKLFIGENNVLVTANGSNLPAPLSFKYYTGINYDGAGFEWEAGGSGGDDMITVDSIDDVYPMLTIPGPVVNPTITNVTTGSVFQYTGTLSSTQTLEVDLMAKTAFLNGVSVIANVTSSSLYFKSGMNRVSYTTNNADAPDATIKWQEIVG